MLPRFGGYLNTTEGGGHNAENTSSLCTRGNELRCDRAGADDRHPADPPLRDGAGRIAGALRHRANWSFHRNYPAKPPALPERIEAVLQLRE